MTAAVSPAPRPTRGRRVGYAMGWGRPPERMAPVRAPVAALLRPASERLLAGCSTWSTGPTLSG